MTPHGFAIVDFVHGVPTGGEMVGRCYAAGIYQGLPSVGNLWAHDGAMVERAILGTFTAIFGCACYPQKGF